MNFRHLTLTTKSCYFCLRNAQASEEEGREGGGGGGKERYKGRKWREDRREERGWDRRKGVGGGEDGRTQQRRGRGEREEDRSEG